MSYENPNILLLDQPVGIDAVIQSIQQSLYALPWLDKSFGRAWEFKEISPEGKTLRVPKVYAGAGEYLNVLPNDNIIAQSFIAIKGPEVWDNYDRLKQNSATRRLSIIFWFNLNRIDAAKDYIFTEELKTEVEAVLKSSPYLKSIEAFIDERAEEVFDTYDLQSVTLSVNDLETQYLMYPFAGFRFDIVVAYPEAVICSPLPFTLTPFIFNYTSNFVIEFIVGDPAYPTAPAVGATTYQNDALIGKKIALYRAGLRGFGAYWSFDSVTGTVTVSPAFGNLEQITIQVYATN